MCPSKNYLIAAGNINANEYGCSNAFTNRTTFDVTNIATTNTINLIVSGAITELGTITGSTWATQSSGGPSLGNYNLGTAFNATNTVNGNAFKS